MGKKVVLFTGIYGQKSKSGEAWAPKTVTFQFPRWLKNRDILDAIRTLCNDAIDDAGASKADKLHPYCEINGVRYLIPSQSEANRLPKVNPAETKPLQEANDNSEQTTTVET